MNDQPKYYPGIGHALDSLDAMKDWELLQVIDSLYGRGRFSFPETPAHGELITEARRQVRLDFLNSEHPAYRENKQNLEAQ